MTELSVEEIKTLSYKRPIIERGYANQTLFVDLANSEINIKPVTEKMKEVFIGGKGFDLWLLWHAVKDSTKWNDPENAICIASGPMAGTPIYPGSGKSIVTTISPLTDCAMDSNVGGYFGPYLKFSGFDALEIVGKAGAGNVIFVDGIDQKIQILN
ncbi:MAG: aldehyde:ferredoxin oxidoreductase, partial [Deltaproteobacteria bacterium]|nr:aldehyde:ferredoxin oxidoreductase [Deltaproteobacteria bacterium]